MLIHYSSEELLRHVIAPRRVACRDGVYRVDDVSKSTKNSDFLVLLSPEIAGAYVGFKTAFRKCELRAAPYSSHIPASFFASGSWDGSAGQDYRSLTAWEPPGIVPTRTPPGDALLIRSCAWPLWLKALVARGLSPRRAKR